MKHAAYTLAIFLATCSPISAQTGATGTWRVEGVGRPFPWEIVLRADGARLVGAVNSCASNRGALEIYDGTIDGIRLSFTCKSGDRNRVITFTGRIDGDEMSLTWELQVQPGGADPFRASDGLFGAAAPRRFTAHRAPDATDEVAELVNRVPGMELSAAVNFLQRDVRVEGTIFVPQKVTRVRAVLVPINFGLGQGLFVSPSWRRLAETLDAALLSVQFSSIGPGPQKGLAAARGDGDGADALISVLQRMAQESGHPELLDAPLLLWGHSGAGAFVSAFAGRYPERTLAFVRYHSGPTFSGEMKAVTKVPALFLQGGKDLPSFNVDAESLWKSGRAIGAPWTFAVEPNATHGDPKDRDLADELMIPWITSVVRQRLLVNGTTLRVVNDTSAWLGNNRTREVAAHDAFPGSKAEASWLPDEASALRWRVVLGTAQ